MPTYQFLIAPIQIRMHGKAEDAACYFLTDRKIAWFVPQSCKGPLKMERPGVVNGRWYAGGFQGILQSFPSPLILCQY